MPLHLHLTRAPIAIAAARELAQGAGAGALAEFTGLVRGEENGATISALEYEAYETMALRVMREIFSSLYAQHEVLAAVVVHRVGVVPVGEAAIYIAVTSQHRAEAFAVVTKFMDRLKQDVPIWKRRALPINPVGDDVRSLILSKKKLEPPHVVSYKLLDEALAEISTRCQPLSPVRVPLQDAIGRVLREPVCAPEDLPSCDRSTRDGFAILQDDASESFQVVATLHAADWQPRQLQPGEAVRVATGAALPGDGLRVVMQEHVERTGDRIKIVRREAAANIRKRGEEMKAGQPLVQAGARLDAGKLALLATAGAATPLVSPRLRVLHFTTGDEIVPPDQTPLPGQVRDSNSILIRALLEQRGCEVFQRHLPEDFARAKTELSTFNLQPSTFNLLLVSGGASVGDKDFTRPLLEWLGFATVFHRISLRPGAPLIFGVAGARVAFGLPGNPLSHFVCFHAFVAAALVRLVGAEAKPFLRGRLAADLKDAACPRETLWPARVGQAFQPAGAGDFPVASPPPGNTGQESPVNRQTGMSALHPLAWASSGDVTCLGAANALLRVPADCASLAAGAEVEFLPTDF